MKIYNVKIKLFVEPKASGVKYRNKFVQGLVMAKSPTEAQSKALAAINLTNDPEGEVKKEVVLCKKLRTDFFITPK